jgi:hypothetical protein
MKRKRRDCMQQVEEQIPMNQLVDVYMNNALHAKAMISPIGSL